MVAKKRKKVVKKESNTCAVGCHSGKGAFAFRGIISILLGLILWFGYLNLTQVFAIVLILVGIKKLHYSTSAC
ncbi:hypothetical protein HON86_02650 [Candidatus Woesearchaeota archaeon]|jgi:uncharacterized membrane protein HdeD (DUF308 family)|nr:hypothetical protein [Candidatus Woesearchaeota archaeon]MBT4835492.1 hypothetical protein [Candidatus Woesearchaeota archaeon]MBT6734816.1 hypothetical protein [Candidatus Woesearchaeota archaeon]MBT7169829.1 hypothetical protein [Candidatus Woesearchaeota archaeon]MBT7474627.1 hypothetical protein [Candidatus Woesearchaeota archaeon]